MKKLLLLPLGAAFGLLSLGVLPGCGSDSKITTTVASNSTSPAAQAVVLDSVINKRHELVMQQTEQIFALRDQLIKAGISPKAPVLAKMQTADRAMMTWMHTYQPPDSSAPAPQRLSYLQDQQKQLTGIEQQLKAALDSAQATLGRATAPKAAAPAPAATQPK